MQIDLPPSVYEQARDRADRLLNLKGKAGHYLRQQVDRRGQLATHVEGFFAECALAHVFGWKLNNRYWRKGGDHGIDLLGNGYWVQAKFTLHPKGHFSLPEYLAGFIWWDWGILVRPVDRYYPWKSIDIAGQIDRDGFRQWGQRTVHPNYPNRPVIQLSNLALLPFDLDKRTPGPRKELPKT